MENAFSLIINMSLTGSVAILLVLLGRFLLRKQPKIFSYALWAVVLFRLLCPVSISAPVSALEVVKPEVAQEGQAISRVTFVAAEPVTIATSAPQTAAPTVIKKTVQPMTIAAWVWLAGLGCMGLYSILAYAALQKKLVGSSHEADNVYLSDYVDTPFVMGIIAPKIYLPTTTPPEERRFILAHEQHHIRRLDHIWKLLAYLAVCLHWFNPLVWVSFVLAGKDMEMSCDEAVIRKLGEHTRADYATALLRLSSKRTVIRGTPLAFGEGDTKGRVKNMANWKEPKIWVSLVCAALCIAVLVACAVNPAEKASAESKETTMSTKWVSVEVPEGYAYDENSMYITRKSDGKLVGGVEIYTIPEGVYDPEDSHFLWLYQIGIQDLEAEKAGELYLKGGMSGFSSDWIMEFTSNEENEADRTVYHRHYFYMVNDLVYDVWEDDLEVTVNTFDSILRFSDSPTAEAPAPMGDNVYRQLMESSLPDGYVFVNEELMTEEESTKTSDQPHSVVGGLMRYDIPEEVDWTDATFQFLEELGIPDVDDPTLAKFGSSDSHCDWLLEVFSDVPEGQPVTVHRYHEFTIVVNEEGHATLMDVWFDATQIDYSQFAGFLSFPYMEAPEADTGEEKERCRVVLEQIQSLAACKIESRQENGDFALNPTAIVTNWINGDDRLSVHVIPESGGYSQFGYLRVEGKTYECASDKVWRETSQWDVMEPWLYSFRWEDSVIAYQDIIQDETGTTVMLQINQPYAEGENQMPFYYANFRFDTEGVFQNVEIKINILSEYSEYSVIKTESVTSLDETEITGEIQKEYQNAQG